MKKCCETCNWDSPIANVLVRLVSFYMLASVSWMKTFSLMLFHNFSIGTEIINHLMTYTSCFYICIFRQTTSHVYFYFKHVYHLSLFWKPILAFFITSYHILWTFYDYKYYHYQTKLPRKQTCFTHKLWRHKNLHFVTEPDLRLILQDFR